MIENAKDGEGRMATDERARAKAEPTQLRNEAQLNCVSLRSELDDEVTCEAVKGQDERQLRAPLTTPQVTTGGLCSSGRDNKEAATSALTFTTFS